MTTEVFNTLEIGNRIHNPSGSLGIVWEVMEIATDQKSLNNWANHGVITERIVKIEADLEVFGKPVRAHSWVGNCQDWEKI